MLQIEQDKWLENISFYIKRAGWAVMSLILISALAGGFGDGPITKKTIKYSSLKASYSTIMRYSKKQSIDVSLTDLSSDTIRMVISKSFLERVKIEHIVPQPTEQVSRGGDVEYRILASKTSADIHLEINPAVSGCLEGFIVFNKDSIKFNDLILP